ncbi:hypothetical protein B0S90_2002 [Caldicellulosiruptor bescii]|uniref:Uncharacterized protein n=3 Tax=Caldicellulosiruptor TaxID=44000 RepID=B9MKD9_CALBD|nr:MULTISPECIES: hypothetical protein [Caldicellulosiruptor]ACM60797.1 conserved hypothetical protein [Caldicellulosiruptor bescii DSM 6725]ADQ45883.1 hypothetical protein Calkro_1012 [Caldicellulosiruptor kronotskyensis 2002]PBC89387.1 hypothetical protein B0S87_2485 [Caldicellulosiruptor bescii]PBC91128.1 hypothetical protein B0S89_1503 [Caldicellulosiruptor bescii]PBD03458.1 hypothetical protein B0S85_1063 [Caldicellulosiruptor bescii]
MKAKKNEKIQDLTIDKYYEELENEALEKLDFNSALLEKLILLKNKLEPMNESPLVKIDIQKVIEDAIEAKAKKQEKVNLLLFILLSFLVFSIYILLININGFGFFVRLQMLFGTLIPWILIPASLIFSKGKV